MGLPLVVALTRPRSVGRLRIDGPDPAAPPRIDLAFLADPTVGERLLEGVRLAQRTGRTPPLCSATIWMEAGVNQDDAVTARRWDDGCR